MKEWEHGKVATYKHKPCRCPDCRAANTLRQNLWRMGQRQREYVPVGPSMKHAQFLCAVRPGQPKTGSNVPNLRWTYRTLSEHIGMEKKQFWRFIGGKNKRILKKYADLILATPDRPCFLEMEENRLTRQSA